MIPRVLGFGAPVTVPPGKTAESASSAVVFLCGHDRFKMLYLGVGKYLCEFLHIDGAVLGYFSEVIPCEVYEYCVFSSFFLTPS